MRLGALVLVALAVLLSATAAGSAQAARDPKTLVLQPSDLPSGFERDRVRYVTNAQANRESPIKKDYAKLGRLRGYEATFERNALTGVIYLSSAASTYKTAAGASDSFAVTTDAVAKSRDPRFRRLSLGSKLGDEARLYKTTLTRDGITIDVFSLAWRSGGVLSVVLGSAVAGTAQPGALVALGRKQQARIAGG